MNIQEHAQLALINVEYAAADCDFLVGLATRELSLKQVASVGSQLALAKRSLKNVITILEAPVTPCTDTAATTVTN